MPFKLSSKKLFAFFILTGVSLLAALALLPAKNALAVGGSVSGTGLGCTLTSTSSTGDKFFFVLNIPIDPSNKIFINNPGNSYVHVTLSDANGPVFTNRKMALAEINNNNVVLRQPGEKPIITTGTLRFIIKLTLGQTPKDTYSAGRTCTVKADQPGVPPAADPTAGRAPAAAGGDTPAGSGSLDNQENQWMAALRSNNKAEQVKLVNKLLGTSYASMDAAVRALDLGYTFAGVEQWRRNQSPANKVTEAGDPALLNVSYRSAASDNNDFQRLFNYLFQLSPTTARQIVAKRTALADKSPWAREVYDKLRSCNLDDEIAKKHCPAGGYPWSLELLASPDIDLSGSAPLFPDGVGPLSLFSFGVLQEGERKFLRTFTAPRVMLALWPIDYAYNHRPAGTPAHADFAAGLTFGSPKLQPDGTYLRSQVMYLPEYAAYMASGGGSAVQGQDPLVSQNDGIAGGDETTPQGDETTPQGDETTPQGDETTGVGDDTPDGISGRPAVNDGASTGSPLKCSIAESSYKDIPSSNKFMFTFKLKVDWSGTKAASRKVNRISIQMISPVAGNTIIKSMASGTNYYVFPDDEVIGPGAIGYKVTVSTIITTTDKKTGKKTTTINYSNSFRESVCNISASRNSKNPPGTVQTGPGGAPQQTPVSPSNPNYRGSKVCGGGTGNTNARQIWNFLISKDLGPKQAAGVLGNIHQESGCIPTESYTERGGFKSYGIAQWNRERLNPPAGLIGFAATKGKSPALLSLQNDFLYKEANQRGNWQGIKLQHDEKAAALYWAKNYEICLADTPDPNDADCNYPVRTQAATWALSQFGN